MMNAVYETSLTQVMADVTIATAMQRTLVPPLCYHGDCIEDVGQCILKDQVGGHLIGLVADGLEVITYVADISGHRLRAGVLMGMAKTAMRWGPYDARTLPLVRALRGSEQPPLRQLHPNDAACCEMLETRWNKMLAELTPDFEDD